MDYEPVMLQTSASRESPVITKTINIFKNPSNTKKRRFFFHLLGEYKIDAWVEICILNYTGREFFVQVTLKYVHSIVYYVHGVYLEISYTILLYYVHLWTSYFLTETYLQINGSASGNFSDPVKFHVKENETSITICVMLVGDFPYNKTSLTDMYMTIDGTAGKSRMHINCIKTMQLSYLIC